MSDNSKLPWGVQSFQPGSLKTITTDKLATFAVGNNKKSRFQKLKEEKEAKEKAEAQAAAEVYNSFVASFEGDEDDNDNNRQNMPMKTFIKEGSSSKTKNMDSLLNEMKQKEQRNDNNNSNNNNKQSLYTNDKSTNSNRVKEMDLFLEELKNKNSNDKIYTSVEYEDDFSTNLYIGNINPNVTEKKLYQLFSRYGEINSIKIMWPRTEEERLKKRNCGFISFMKRKDAESAKNELQNYNLDDYEMILQWSKAVKINSIPYTLSLSTNNSNFNLDIVNTTQAAVEETKMMMNEGKSFMEIYQATLATFQTDQHSNPNNTSNSKWDQLPFEPEMKEGDSCINIIVPSNKVTQNLIDLTAKFVASDGDYFEKVIKQREESNPLFSFLFQSETSDGQYYRWRTYANIVGDDGKRYRTKPFKLTAGGPFIVPPKKENKRSRSDHDENNELRSRRMRSRSNSQSSRSRSSSSERDDSKYSSMTSAQIRQAKTKLITKQKQLSQRSFNEFNDTLLNLTISNLHIKSAMGFVFDHADSAEEIIEIIKKSLIDDEIKIPIDEGLTSASMPIPAKIARLYLISDILHNSGAPIKNAYVYRNLIQAILPEIFEHLGEILRSKYKIGRLSGKQVEEKVSILFNAWMEWLILPQPFMQGLEAAFYLTEADIENFRLAASKDIEDSITMDTYADKDALLRKAKNRGIFYTSSSTPSEIKSKLECIEKFVSNKYGIKKKIIATESVSVDDVDGVPVDDIDGVSVDDDIDGVSVNDDDIDGVPIDDDDIDGVPVEC